MNHRQYLFLFDLIPTSQLTLNNRLNIEFIIEKNILFKIIYIYWVDRTAFKCMI